MTRLRLVDLRGSVRAKTLGQSPPKAFSLDEVMLATPDPIAVGDRVLLSANGSGATGPFKVLGVEGRTVRLDTSAG